MHNFFLGGGDLKCYLPSEEGILLMLECRLRFDEYRGW